VPLWTGVQFDLEKAECSTFASGDAMNSRTIPRLAALVALEGCIPERRSRAVTLKSSHAAGRKDRPDQATQVDTPGSPAARLREHTLQRIERFDSKPFMASPDRTRRVWEISLGDRMLAEWSTIEERSPYMFIDGAVVPRRPPSGGAAPGR
jgi:hypothetical protein